MYSTKIKVKELEKKLVEYQNAVLILDDVKKEETVRNRENAKNVTDLAVRSIYMGKLGQAKLEDDRVNATAIITGEFFKEQMSTISRILYLNIGSFLQEGENSKNFNIIQRDKTYFAGFMIFFIQWLFKSLEKKKQDLNLKRIIENIFEKITKEPKSEKLLVRMYEIKTCMLICTKILYEYLKNVLGEDNSSVNEFYEKCIKVINKLIRDTWLRSLNYQPIYVMAFDDIILRLKIKDCRYGETFLNARDAWYGHYFPVVENGERGISFTDKINKNEKAFRRKYFK